MAEKTFRPLPLEPRRFGEESQFRQRWTSVVPKGTPMETLLLPHFWSKVAHRLTRHDLIEVTADDGDYFVELLVLGREAGDTNAGVIVQPLRGIGIVEVAGLFDNQAQPNRLSLQVRYGGPVLKWCVVKPGGEVVAEGLGDAAAGRQWIDDHLISAEKRGAA